MNTKNENTTNNSNLVTHKISLENFEKIRSMDMKDGFWEVYYSDGTLRMKGTYLNGEQDGFWEYYYEDGTPDMIGSYIDGVQDGFWEYFYEDGTLEMRGNYLDGEREGFWEFYKEDTCFMRGFYRNGKRNGLWEHYYEDGALGRKKPTTMEQWKGFGSSSMKKELSVISRVSNKL